MLYSLKKLPFWAGRCCSASYENCDYLWLYIRAFASGALKITHKSSSKSILPCCRWKYSHLYLFDASILKGPAFELLSKQDVFNRPEIAHGVVTWNNGLIDCAPEYMYEHSYEYAEADKLHVWSVRWLCHSERATVVIHLLRFLLYFVSELLRSHTCLFSKYD